MADKIFLSKIKLGGQDYWLKDADLRAVVAAFGDAVNYNVDKDTISVDGNLATVKAMKAYIEAQVAGLTGAMHFVGIKEELPATGSNGDVVIVGTAEYVYSDGKWNLIGDEGIYATQAGVKKLTEEDLKIAGVAFGEDKAITANELLVALGLDKLGSLAWKNSASGSIETVDSASGKCAGGEYNVSGTEIVVPQSYTALDVTPAGAVTVTANQAAAATYEKASSLTLSAQASESGNYTPSGSISLPSIQITHAPTNSDVAVVTDAGTAYSLTNGEVTMGQCSSGQFLKEASKATIGAADENGDFTLEINDASVFGDAITACGQINYTAPVLSGALPTFGTKSVVSGLGEATASYNGDASFAGATVQIGGTINHETVSANVTQPTFQASFEGTAKTVTPVAATTASAMAKDGAKIAIGEHDVTVTLAKTNKVISVQ